MKVSLISLLALASSAPQAASAGHIRRLDKSSTSSDNSSKGKGCNPTDPGYLIEKALKLQQISEELVREFGEGSDVGVGSTGVQALVVTMPGLVVTDLDGDGDYDKNEVTVALNTYLDGECVDDYYDKIVSTKRFDVGGGCADRCFETFDNCQFLARSADESYQCVVELNRCLSRC